MKCILPSAPAVLLVAVLLSGTGCAAFRASTRPIDVGEDRHYDAEFDYADMRGITRSVVDDMLQGFLGEERPIMMIAGVENRTSQYVDTKNLTDRMRTLLINEGSVPFVSAARRADLLQEQQYQAQHATAETRVAAARQLGAQYMVSGSLTEMEQREPDQVRLARRKINYYKLTIEVTDLETGLIAWTTEKEFARLASRPLIGW